MQENIHSRGRGEVGVCIIFAGAHIPQQLKHTHLTSSIGLLSGTVE